MSSKKEVSFQKGPRTSSNNVKPLDESNYLYRTKFSSTAVRPSSRHWNTLETQQAASASTANKPPRSQTMKNAAKTAETHYYMENPSKLPLPTPALPRPSIPTAMPSLPTPMPSSNPTLSGPYKSLGTISVPTGSGQRGGKARRRKTRKARKSKKSRKVRRS